MQDAACHVELRGPGLQRDSLVDHVDADLKRLVRKGDVGEVQIQIDVLRVEQDSLPERADRTGRVAGLFIGRGCEAQRLGIRPGPVEKGCNGRNGVLGLLGHELNGRQQLPLARIVRLKRHRPLKHADGAIELFQADEAGCVCMQSVELGIDEGAGLLEMRDGILTIALPVFQHRQHGVAGRIGGTQSQQAVQERHGTATSGLVVD